MTRVLVTGGAGVLGSDVVRALQARDATVRILSHRAAPRLLPRDAEWAQANLLHDNGHLAVALHEVDTVVHCASRSTRPADDVAGTQHLLAAARDAEVGHLVYISIVGIDPLGFFDYYRAKREVEEMLPGGGVPYSLLRATQFHDFVAYLLALLMRGPLHLLPRGVILQPVQVEAVAARLADAALAPPAERLPDLAGPETRSLRDLAHAWRGATGRRALPLSVPLPGAIFRAMRGGQVTNPAAEQAGETWDAWLAQHAREPNRYARAHA